MKIAISTGIACCIITLANMDLLGQNKPNAERDELGITSNVKTVRKLLKTESHEYDKGFTTFDKYGNIVSKLNIADDGTSFYIYYLYEENRLKASIINTEISVYEYNNSGELIKRTAYDTGHYYHFNSNGTLASNYYGTEHELSDIIGNTSPGWQIHYRYNRKGQLIKETQQSYIPAFSRLFFYGRRSGKITTRYKYNSKGLCIKEVCNSPHSSGVTKSIVRNTYDSLGNLVFRETKSKSDEFDDNLEHHFFFYNSNKQITRQYLYNPAKIGSGISFYEYEYNEMNKLAKKWHYRLEKVEDINYNIDICVDEKWITLNIGQPRSLANQLDRARQLNANYVSIPERGFHNTVIQTNQLIYNNEECYMIWTSSHSTNFHYVEYTYNSHGDIETEDVYPLSFNQSNLNCNIKDINKDYFVPLKQNFKIKYSYEYFE